MTTLLAPADGDVRTADVPELTSAAAVARATRTAHALGIVPAGDAGESAAADPDAPAPDGPAAATSGDDVPAREPEANEAPARGRRLRRPRRARKHREPRPPRDAGPGDGFLAKAGPTVGMALALAVVAAAAAYLTFPHSAPFTRIHGSWAAGLISGGALAAIIAAVAMWRAARRRLEGRKSADVLTVAAAAVATTVSASGMWAFFAAYVPGIPVLIRIPLFAFLEIATLASALRARDNMRERARRAAEGIDEDGGIDIDKAAMWALTGTSAFLASLASTTPAEAIFRLAPPLVAAWLWERALVSEKRRIQRGKGKSITWRISPQRLLVKFGLADPAGKTLGETAANRRITVLALAVERVTALESAGSGPGTKAWQKADQQLRTALRQAVEQADLHVNPARQEALVSQISILSNPHHLVSLNASSPWSSLAAPAPRDARNDERKPAGAHADRKPAERPKAEQPKPQRPRPVPAAQPGSLEQLAGTLSRALRQRDTEQVHQLLAGRADYPAIARWLGRRSKFGDKRLMALVALYAEPASSTSPAKGAAWVTGIVPGKPGEIDTAELRRLRALLEPAWTAHGHMPAAASAGGKDNQE